MKAPRLASLAFAFLFSVLCAATAPAAAPATAVSKVEPPAAAVTPANDYHVFFGTSQRGANRGLSLSHFDAATGALTVPAFDAATTSPSFFALAADGRHLYACNSVDNLPGQTGGGLSAFALDPATGRLTALNTQPSGGTMPTYTSLDRAGRFALVANYNSGSVAVFPILPDGSLGPRTGFAQHTGHSVNPSRQSSPHAHSIITSPDNRFALAADLGLDQILIYRFDDQTGALTPNAPAFATLPPGSGPRHLAFSPNGKFAFVTSELANTVTAFEWDAAKGALTALQTASTLPADFKGASACAEIGVHPSGKFLYASNRGHDSLAVFALDEATGRLSPVQHISTAGKTPRSFSLDPTGRWLICVNQDSNNTVVFRVDAATGQLAQTGEPVSVPNPFCPRFLAVPHAAASPNANPNGGKGSVSVKVIGDVVQSGTYQLGLSSVLKAAIAAAGGFTHDAEYVVITRTTPSGSVASTRMVFDPKSNETKFD